MQRREHGGRGLGGTAKRTTRVRGRRMPVRGQAAAAHEGPACSMARVKGKKVERLQQEDQGSLQGGGCTEGGHSEGEEAVEGGCAVRGCTSAATRPAQGCTQGSRRRDRPDHMMVSCRGAKGKPACECGVAEVGTDKCDRTLKKAPGIPGMARGMGSYFHLATWGRPIPDDQHAARAVRTTPRAHFTRR